MGNSSIDLNKYLHQEIQCECGRIHSSNINAIEVSEGAINRLPNLIKEKGYSKVFLIADVNTMKVAGTQVADLLTVANLDYQSFILKDEHVIPDETTIGAILMGFDPSCDLVVAVGSGTINDIGRFFSHRIRLPYYIVATAPSMDGYASNVAPLIKNNLKTTFEGHVPEVIIADLEIIAKAPKEMIAAGFGDVVGKYTCLADWKLSSIINDEYYCARVEAMTRESLEKTVQLKERIAEGEPHAIGGLMEALILAGIAMSYVGNSRPASGSEHHLSHFWEMRFLSEGKPAILHGTKVGLASILISRLYEMLSKEDLSEQSILKTKLSISINWEEEILNAYLDAGTEIIMLEKETQKNSPAEWQKRINTIAVRYSEILDVLQSVPSGTVIENLIHDAGGTTKPSDVGIDINLVRLGVLYGKEVRPRYTILQLLWDLNLLKDYSFKANS